MGLHIGRAVREQQLKLLDAASAPFRAVHGAPGCVPEGWLRAVRVAVGITQEEMVERLGVQRREIFRLEQAEMESSITLAMLKRSAEALDCELIYGLRPKEGTLVEMAAERSVARAKALHAKRLAADEQRAAEGKPRRLRDPKLGAIDELLRLAGVRKSSSYRERLSASLDRRLGRHAKKIARVVTDQAKAGNYVAARDIMRLTGLMK